MLDPRGLTGIAAIEAIHIHAVTLPLKEGAKHLAALDVRQRGSLAAWYSSALLVAAGDRWRSSCSASARTASMTTAAAIAIWLWTAAALAWLSLDAATGMHDALGLAVTLLAGTASAYRRRSPRPAR